MLRLFGCVLALFFFSTNSHAVLFVGNVYQDADGNDWEYIGDYNVGDPAAPSWPPATFYNALEAAEIVFGPLDTGLEYAISTLDDFVDHMAWVDGWGSGLHLPTYNTYGGGVPVAEDFSADVGAPGYNTVGDYTAWVSNDRATVGGGAFNHVFVTAAAVPEPAIAALMGLGLAGIGFARKKKEA